MNNLKKVFSNFVLRSDLLSEKVTLRYAGNSDYESYCTGFISIVTVSVFIAIFIVKLLSVLQLQDITAFEHLTDNLQSSEPISDIMFAMTIQNLGMTTIDKYFQFTVTQVNLSRPSGSNSSKTRIQRKIALMPCRIQYWEDMDIESMPTIFEKRGMSAYYCPTQEFVIQGTSDQDTYIYSEIRLNQCNTSNANCEQNTTLRNLYYQNFVNANEYFNVNLMIRDTIISPKLQNAISNYVQKDILLTFSTTTGTIGYLKIADYEVDTDTNVLPWTQYESQTGYYIENFQTTTVPSTTKFVYLKLEKSTKKFTVEREYGKIDDMLSYVGGLFGLLFYCIQFVMSSYNEYRYQLGVGEVLFNYDDDGNQSKSNDMGFWTYVKYSIYDWFAFFGLEMTSWTQMKQINQTREQVNEQMDVRHLMEKIRYLENVVEVLISDEQRISLLFSQRPTMEKLKKIRKVADFYNYQKNPNAEIQLQKLEKSSRINVSSENMSHGGPNQTNYLINFVANEQLGRASYDDKIPVKQANYYHNGRLKSESSLEAEVSEAVLKVIANDNDPINQRILSLLRPSVVMNVRSKSQQNGQMNALQSNRNSIEQIPSMRKNTE